MSSELQAGTVIADRYRLQRPIGRGGFGDVWRAYDSRTKNTVALKVLRSLDAHLQQRFEIEVEVLGRLRSPHCVSLIDAGQLDDGQAYLVTDYLHGPTLAEWLEVPRPEDELRQVAQQMSAALVHAHREGILHRDLKPTNVVLTEAADGSRHANVLDFGIAKLTGAQLQDVTKTGEVFGTPGYMSPEQLRAARDIGPATDVYSLGVVLFEMFERRPPFGGESRLDTAMSHLLDPAPTLQTGPAEVRELVAMMLAKDPAHRPTMLAVSRVLDGRPALTDASTGGFWSTSRLVVAVLFVAALIGLAVLAIPGPEEDLPQTRRPRINPKPKRTPQKIAVPVPVPVDLGPDPIRRGRSAGCGHSRRKSGNQKASRLVGVDSEAVFVRLPPSYDENVPAPVVVAFHDLLQHPRHMLELPSFIREADAAGVVVVAPLDTNPYATWSTASDVHNAIDRFELAADELCLDLDRVMLFGHGNGGYGAEQFACLRPGVTSIATSSFRMWGDHELCGVGEPPPTLVISPIEDDLVPADGTRKCFDVREVRPLGADGWPLLEHESKLRKRHGCQPTPPVPELGCVAPTCDSALELCRVKGGRFWPDMKGIGEYTVLFNDCEDRRNPDFPFAKRIFEFFAEHDPG